jgi:phosphohistidine phosphatase
MKLILIRHAEAIDREEGIVEANRYLTPAGRDFFRKTARTLRDRKLSPDLILTSPLLRAVQTADILAEALDYRGPLLAVEELEPGCGLAELRQLLDRHPQARELVMVGHEPDFGTMVGELLDLPHGFAFKKGTAVKLTVAPKRLAGGGRFKWLASGKGLITSRQKACG